jgi:hypothetical protein
VARLLLEKSLPVRAIVRSADERARSLRALGAEIFVPLHGHSVNAISGHDAAEILGFRLTPEANFGLT